MKAGVRLYNKHDQVMVNNEDICYGFSQKLSATTSSPYYSYNRALAKVTATGCINPLIVYGLGDADTRIQVLNGTSNIEGFTLEFYSSKKAVTGDIYVFDISGVAQKKGQQVFRLYRPDGELAFDNRILNLEIVGEAVDGMALDPNKQYGILLRSKAPFLISSRYWREGRRVWEEQIRDYEIAWRDGDTLRRQMVREHYMLDWWWADTGGVGGIDTTNSLASNKALAAPLLVDLTLIKYLES